jgi:hypothetical protein
VQVRNYLAHPAECRVELGDGTSAQKADVSLPANGTGEVSFPLPGERGFVQTRVRALLPGGASASAEALLATARSVRAESADDGWERVPRYGLDDFPGGFFPESLRQAVTEKPGACGEAGDLSAKFASRWDDRVLHLRVEVTDDRHCQSQAAGEAWQQDSVQLLLEPRPLVEPARRLEFDVDLPAGFAAGAGAGAKPRVFGRRAPGVEALPAEAVAGIAVDVQRSGQQTIYTVAVPWAALGLDKAPAAGTEVGLAIVINDDDEDGRGRHGLQWFFGIHGFRGQYDRLGSLWLAE